MHRWRVKDGSVEIQVQSLRPNRFGARLYIFDPNRDAVEIHPRVDALTGIHTFELPASVAESIAAGTEYIFLTTRHTLPPGASDLKWGWRYKIKPGTGYDADDETLKTDDDGWIPVRLEKFDEIVELDRLAIDFTK